MSRRTNLRNIVQNPDERVAILRSRSSHFFLHQLTIENYLPLKHLELVSLRMGPSHDGYAGTPRFPPSNSPMSPAHGIPYMPRQPHAPSPGGERGEDVEEGPIGSQYLCY